MRLALALAVFVAGCANPPRHVEEQPKPTRIKSPDGQILCAIHKIPLTTIHGWRSDAIILEHPIGAEATHWDDCNPNRIFSGYSRTRTKDCTIPAEITFCKWCNEGVGCDF
jgi:hypothetical protein